MVLGVTILKDISVPKLIIRFMDPDLLKVHGRMHSTPYCSHGYIPLRYGWNIVIRIGKQQQNSERMADRADTDQSTLVWIYTVC